MNKYHPDLRAHQAERAIKSVYQTKLSSEMINKLLIFCTKENSKVFAKHALQFQREKINRIIVNMVINEMLDIQKKFIRMRYQQGMSFTKIALELHVSEGQLFIWNRQFFDEIKSMLQFTLTDEAVFNHNKVLNIVNILDYRISFIERSSSLKYDCNICYLNDLIVKRNNYHKLLIIIQQHMNKYYDIKDTYHNIVAIKLKNPRLNRSELAVVCGVSLTTVCRKLDDYKSLTRQYI